MRLFYILLISTILYGCSFDNKSGIWNNYNTPKKKVNQYSDFKTLSLETENFNQIIQLKEYTNLKIEKSQNILDWKDFYFSKENNFRNFLYNDLNKLRYRSKKITSYKLNNFIVAENDKLILSDEQGSLIVFSLFEGKIIKKYNFYKNKFKKIKKHLYFAIDKNIIYVADNIGYLYAYNIDKDKIVWAKNLKVPFRSNLKIINNKIVISSQNNNLFYFDKKGNQLVLIPTEETIVKNEFINNISSSNESTFFLNTYGSIYSIDNNRFKMNWFINLNQSIDLNTSNQFNGSEVINFEKAIVISSNKNTFVINKTTGTIEFKKKFSSIIKPLISNNLLFLISKNNLLICMNIKNGNILYSYNINEKIAEFLNVKKRKVEFNSMMLLNSKIFIFLKNSYVLKFKLNGNLEKIIKLPTKIASKPIIIDKSILYVDSNNKLSVID